MCSRASLLQLFNRFKRLHNNDNKNLHTHTHWHYRNSGPVYNMHGQNNISLCIHLVHIYPAWYDSFQNYVATSHAASTYAYFIWYTPRSGSRLRIWQWLQNLVPPDFHGWLMRWWCHLMTTTSRVDIQPPLCDVPTHLITDKLVAGDVGPRWIWLNQQ